MSTETLTAPPEETTAADPASEPAGAFEEAEAGAEPAAFAEEAVSAPVEAKPAPATAAKGKSAPAEPSVKDELTAQFEAEAAAEAAAAAATQAAAQATAGPQSRVMRLLTLPLRLVVGVFVLLDMPFGFLGAGIKKMIGGVAIITALMAAATWIGGPRLAATLAAPTQEKPAEVREAKEAGGKKPAKPGEKPAAKHEEEAATQHH
jgi:hypothetical protein